jgi:hypothetical protein
MKRHSISITLPERMVDTANQENPFVEISSSASAKIHFLAFVEICDFRIN